MANQPFTTPEGRLVWSPGLWTAEAPQQNPQGAKKFSCSLAIPLSDPGLPKLIAEYNAVVINELGASPPAQEGGLAILPRNCNDPCLEFGAIVHPDQPEAAGVILLKVGRREEDGAPEVYLDPRTPCINKADIYSGCWGHFHAKFWTYNSKFHGVSCDLFAFLKTRDDTPTGRIDPDSSAAFAGIQGVGVSTVPVGTPAPANFAIPGVQPLPAQPLPGQPVQPAQVQPVQPAQVQPVQPLPVQPLPVYPAQVQPVQPLPVQAPLQGQPPIQYGAQAPVPVGSLVQAPQPAVAPADPYFDHVPF